MPDSFLCQLGNNSRHTAAMPIPAEHASLAEVAAALAAPGKGLLASDESVGTVGKRLERAGLVNDEVHRS
jgi:fructose-bisphosphate aldolase class I